MEQRHFENHKQLLEYQNFLLLIDIWRSKFKSIFKCGLFFQRWIKLNISGSLRQLLSCVGIEFAQFYWSKQIQIVS